MKITKIHIESFGKLSQYDLDLQDGLNTIMEENGWGKSTLAAYLRVMFYGLSGERKQGYSENERKKYTPWNKGAFGGSVEFEKGGTRYILTRSFGQKDKDCTFRLQDADTLLESKDFSEKIGEELFGIDRDSFGKTSFIDHEAIHYAGINSDIESKVGAVSQRDDLQNYDKAAEIMKDYLNKFSPKSKKGSLYQQNDEIAQLKQSVTGKNTLEKTVAYRETLRDEEKRKLEEIMKERADLQKKLSGLSRDREKAMNLKRLKELEGQAQDRKHAVKEREESFANGIPSQEEIVKLEKQQQEAETQSARLSGFVESSASERMERLKRYFRNGVPQKEEIETQIRNCNDLQNLFQQETSLEAQEETQKQKLEEYDLERKRLEAANALKTEEKRKQKQKKLMISGICLAAGVLLALAILLLKLNALIWIPAVALILAGAFILLQYKMHSMAKESTQIPEEQLLKRQMEEGETVLKKIRQDRRNLEENARELELQIREFLESMEIPYSRADAESLLYEMKNRVVEYVEMQREKEESELQHQEVLSQVQRCNGALENIISEMGLQLDAKDYPGIKNWIAETRSHLTSLNVERQEEKKASESVEAFRNAHPELADQACILTEEEITEKEEWLGRRVREISDEEAHLHEIISSYNRELEDLFGRLEDIAEQQERLEDLKEIHEKESARYQMVLKTQEYLQTAKEQFIARYMNPVKSAFDGYYQLLTNGKGSGSEFQIDANMNISRKEEGEFRDIQAQSEGYADMIGLCIRMALLDVMYQDERPMVIMDDPFFALDENNLQGAKQFLDHIAKKYQVLYLTCHKSRQVTV